MTEEIYHNRAKYGVKEDQPQEIQRLYGTDISKRLMDKNYDGVIDCKEILIENHNIIKILNIEEI
ncbi:hypothetical protein ACF3NX_15490 (plasmid) [Acetobacter orientalis]|uniref:hypothetical protein n=1 Tax=Acetobacter orientalis TaxID=146474 RepID=UPI00386D7D25